jgi:hypothetical protein
VGTATENASFVISSASFLLVVPLGRTRFFIGGFGNNYPKVEQKRVNAWSNEAFGDGGIPVPETRTIPKV